MTLSVCLRHAFPGFDLDVAFEAPPGVTVLFGPSGSGKTSLINAVAGLLRPDTARIAAGDWVLVDTASRRFLPPHRRRLGYIFQEGRLFPHMSVRQNLLYGRWFAPRDAKREDFGHVVEMLGIGHLLDRRPGALSGGEKQRVAIARVLVKAPPIVIFDEATSSLDSESEQQILEALNRLAEDQTTLAIAHRLSTITDADEIVVMEAGRVVERGSHLELLEADGRYAELWRIQAEEEKE